AWGCAWGTALAAVLEPLEPLEALEALGAAARPDPQPARTSATSAPAPADLRPRGITLAGPHAEVNPLVSWRRPTAMSAARSGARSATRAGWRPCRRGRQTR